MRSTEAAINEKLQSEKSPKIPWPVPSSVRRFRLFRENSDSMCLSSVGINLQPIQAPTRLYSLPPTGVPTSAWRRAYHLLPEKTFLGLLLLWETVEAAILPYLVAA
jgi:hypothetical protein